eukprot:5792745-Pyramimonas_sp.AAC.2
MSASCVANALGRSGIGDSLTSTGTTPVLSMSPLECPLRPRPCSSLVRTWTRPPAAFSVSPGAGPAAPLECVVR